MSGTAQEILVEWMSNYQFPQKDTTGKMKEKMDLVPECEDSMP